jgi:DNA-binding NarL/FixJ family response regulator
LSTNASTPPTNEDGRASQDPNVIKVVIIEDQRDVREGLAVLINGSPGFRCLAAFRTMEDALRSIGGLLPDVVLTDIGLPGMSGVDGTRILKEQCPDLPIVALTIYDDDEGVFDALCAGASGYLLKNTPPAKLLESLKEVASGGAPMSPEVARRVIKLFREFRPPERASHRLTPQETELLKLIIEGHSYKTAAARLDISVSTVSFHLQNIYNKLQVHSKTEAVAKALQNKLV